MVTVTIVICAVSKSSESRCASSIRLGLVYPSSSTVPLNPDVLLFCTVLEQDANWCREGGRLQACPPTKGFDEGKHGIFDPPLQGQILLDSALNLQAHLFI